MFPGRVKGFGVTAGICALAEFWAQDVGAVISRVSPSEIKKHAVGKGNAKKDELVVAAARKWPDQDIKTNDQADALWLLDLMISEVLSG